MNKKTMIFSVLFLLLVVIFVFIGLFWKKLIRPSKPGAVPPTAFKAYQYKDTGYAYELISPAISFSLNYSNSKNPTQGVVTDPYARQQGSQEIIQTWLTPQFMIETPDGKLTPIALTLTDHTSPELTEQEAIFIQNLSTTNPDRGIELAVQLKRKVLPQTGELITELTFTNQGKKPCLIRTDNLLPNLIPHEYGSSEVFFPSGYKYSKELSDLKPTYLAFYEAPLGIRFKNPKNNSEVILYNDGINNTRINLNVMKQTYLCDFMNDPINQILHTNDQPGKDKYILPWILPGKSFNFQYHLRLNNPTNESQPGIAYLGWFPQGYETAFCLQADEIKPDVITPKTSENRYKALEEVMLGKIHREFPSMKMQAIVVVDDMNPYNPDKQDNRIAPQYRGENDLTRNPQDVERYRGWLNKGKGFFKLQSHAVHHTPVSKPAGIGYTGHWEFDPTDKEGSGKWANDYQWVTAMIKRLKTELESLGLGKQRYFKAAGYRRSYPLAQVLAEQGYWIWDFNCNTGSEYTEPFHLRYRYTAPGGQVMWVVGSGTAIEGYKVGQDQKYWTDMNNILSRGYPLITSGHLEWFNDPAIYALQSKGWKKMYQTYRVWNTFPDEMADYWEQRYHLIVEQTTTAKGIRIKVTNPLNFEIKNATVCYLSPTGPLQKIKEITLDNAPVTNTWEKSNVLYLWTDIPKQSTKTFEIKMGM